MADYGKLYYRIWADPDFVALDSRPQQLYMMLCSYPTKNAAGILPLTLRRWAKSTADATVANVTAALRALDEARFLVIDWDSEEVLIRTHIRNDEVYRQPNLMKSALRFVQQVESNRLKTEIHDELTRLPPHKDADETKRIANLLVDGLPETPTKPFQEPLLEPYQLIENQHETSLLQGSGVGSYVSGVRTNPQPSPSPSPSPSSTGGHLERATHVSDASARDAEQLDENFAAATNDRGDNLGRPVSIGATRLVASVIAAGTIGDADRTILRIKASEAVAGGRSDDDVAECLRIWLTKTDLGPHALLCCLTEVDKRKLGNRQLATSDRKFLEVQSMKTQPPGRISQLLNPHKEIPDGP